MRIVNFNTKTEAVKARNELYETGFYGDDLTIQYNGNIRKYQLIIQDEDESYRPNFEFENNRISGYTEILSASSYP